MCNTVRRAAKQLYDLKKVLFHDTVNALARLET